METLTEKTRKPRGQKSIKYKLMIIFCIFIPALLQVDLNTELQQSVLTGACKSSAASWEHSIAGDSENAEIFTRPLLVCLVQHERLCLSRTAGRAVLPQKHACHCGVFPLLQEWWKIRELIWGCEYYVSLPTSFPNSNCFFVNCQVFLDCWWACGYFSLWVCSTVCQWLSKYDP